MPMLQFKCQCGHEFEKIIKPRHEIHKWCIHCDRLTMWKEIDDPHSELYRQKVCMDCLGNQHVSPVLPTPRTKNETNFAEVCPVCGKLAEHVLRIETRGKQDIGHSSIRFHFNYLPASDN
jgi:hypothetical protein